MKRIIAWGIVVLSVIVVVGGYMNRPRPVTSPEAAELGPEMEPALKDATEAMVIQPKRPPESTQRVALRSTGRDADEMAGEAPELVIGAISRWPENRLVVRRAIETLVSPMAGYDQKNAAWKSLLDSGRLDEAIDTLEEKVTDNPRDAESAAALGQGYYEKCGVVKDVREQAILAMKADEALEVALDLDPAHWQARFLKAAGMSYWPQELGKGPDVIEQFRTLIVQQEGRPAEPQYAQSYVGLGDAYLKAGQPEYATQIWERGAAWFPENGQLKKRLAGSR